MSDQTKSSAFSTCLEKATLDQRNETARALKGPKSLKQVLKMTKRALARVDQILHDVAEIIPSPQPIACASQCPYCCHIRVTASPPEILLVLDQIQSTWDEESLTALKRKVGNIDGRTRGLDDDARAKLRLPCPLLKNGSCAVHDVRPLSCRGVSSVDLKSCKAAYNSYMRDGVPMYDPQFQAANAIGYGLYAGLLDQGFDPENVELTAALSIGLKSPDIGRSWLKSDDPFAPACALKL